MAFGESVDIAHGAFEPEDPHAGVCHQRRLRCCTRRRRQWFGLSCWEARVCDRRRPGARCGYGLPPVLLDHFEKQFRLTRDGSVAAELVTQSSH